MSTTTQRTVWQLHQEAPLRTGQLPCKRCHGCGNKGHWKTKCRKSQKADKGQTSKRPQHPKKPKGRRTDEIDVDQDEIIVARLADQGREDLETIAFANISIDMMTEAFATLEIPAGIGPKHLANIKCKVDTGARGNVMTLRAFAKLFPNRIGKKKD